jgi:hypothetical protein
MTVVIVVVVVVVTEVGFATVFSLWEEPVVFIVKTVESSLKFLHHCRHTRNFQLT